MRTKTITNPDMAPFPVSRAEVVKLYHEQLLSLEEIGKKVGCSRQRLARWMNYWEIPRRECIEASRLQRKKEGAERGPNWRGGQWCHKATETWFTWVPEHPRKRPNGGVCTYVLAAEDRLGRYLNKGEHVHHLDANRSNNVGDNLCVMTGSQHAVLHKTLGNIGIELINQGKLWLVLSLLGDKEKEKNLVSAVYEKKLPCITHIIFED